MASIELRKLWKLHLIDKAILETKKRAENLDVGQAERREYATFAKDYEETSAKAKELSSEQIDLELQQKAIEEKLKKIEKEEFSGKSSSRELANLEKEKEMLKRQRSTHDDRLLELMDDLPPLQAKFDAYETRVNGLKKKISAKRAVAAKDKATLEAHLKDLLGRRPEAAKLVSPALLARYDSIRTRHGGIGMAEVIGAYTCEACGTNIAPKIVDSIEADRLETCESCHLILFHDAGAL